MTTPALDTLPRARPGLVSVDGRTYPLESVDVRARAEGGRAVTTLHQRFRNPHEEALEVLYTLPLPADGAVLGYTVRMGETVIRGEVEPRERAAARYREALYQGRTAGLLEQDRADAFRQALGNLPPGEGVEVEIRVLHPLAFLPADEDARARWEYRFPTVVGVRYQGAPGRVPDAERLDAERADEGGLPVRAGLEVTVADAGPGAEIDSPGHRVVAEPGAEGARVRFAEPEPLDRDIVLRWPAAPAEVGVRLVEGGGLEGDDGRYALLTVVPPARPRAVLPRDLTVLLDASGSMRGEPLAHAKMVVEGLLGSLGSGDRFELLAFSNRPARLTPGLAAATPEALAHARGELRALDARGGTEMRRALDEALAPVREGSQRQVVLVTDGWIGFEGEVVGRVARGLPGGVRVHVVGIGSAPNRTLTRGLARAGGGAELLVGDEAGAREAARRLTAATARPVLTGLALGGSALRHAAPAGPRDVLAGEPAVLTAELEPTGGTLELRGTLAGQAEPWEWRGVVAPAGAPAAGAGTSLPLGALHGREAIEDLEVRLAAGEAPERVRREIEGRGMRHRIASRETSLVAVAEVASADPRAPRRREKLAVELPAGVSAEGVGLGMGRGGLRVRDVGVAYSQHVSDPGPGFASSAPDSEALDDGLAPDGGAFGEPVFEPARRERKRRPWDRLGKRREGARKERKEGRARPAPEPEVTARATLVRSEGTLLVLEVEVPVDGFLLPTGRVEIRDGGRPVAGGMVVPAEGSPVGPHGAGLLVRLAVRLERGAAVPAGAFEIGGRARVRRSGEADRPVPCRLRVEAPARPGADGGR